MFNITMLLTKNVPVNGEIRQVEVANWDEKKLLQLLLKNSPPGQKNLIASIYVKAVNDIKKEQIKHL